MKTIEVRRHSTRAKPGEHLSQAGVSLARRVGESAGPFERVVTSTLPRAFETAIAMGFAVDQQDELLNTYGAAVEAEVPWPADFADYAAAAAKGGPAAKYASKLTTFYANLAKSLPEGRATLVVSHGGVVELSAVGCVPSEDYRAWGGYLDVCEGVRLFSDAGKFVKAEVLRISK